MNEKNQKTKKGMSMKGQRTLAYVVLIILTFFCLFWFYVLFIKMCIRDSRHTASHVLAQAVQTLFPDAKVAIGPSIDTGFYYDFDCPPSVSYTHLDVYKRQDIIIS